MSRWEQRVLLIFTVLFLLSGLVLLRTFYLVSTHLVPATGGTYIEGSVGELQPLNPWFIVQNDVNRDLVSLIFAGLLKFNPETKEIEEDLATIQVSGDGKLYTLRLKDDLHWHDATEADPHPVTADDVLFTFRTIQDPKFPNKLLQQNFRGVTVEKVDDRTVQFRLDEVYAFFPSNLTLGLVPERSFEGIPVEKLDQALDFGFHPIGAGPYKFKDIAQTELSTEVTLERVPRSLEPEYRLERLVMRIFLDYPTLLADLRNLDGVRLVPRNDKGQFLILKRFVPRSYTLPQYVALFFNLDREILQDQQLRLGLQLGTNKQQVADTIHETLIVDTPLLEADVSNWRYRFDPEAAQGALFASNWHLPEKLRLQRLLEEREANDVGILKLDPVIYLETGAVLTITGSLQNLELPATIQGIPVQRHPTATGSWIVALPTHSASSGALTVGMNLLRLLNANGRTIDSFYLRRTITKADYDRAEREQALVRLFVKSRSGNIDAQERVTIEQFTLDHGMLRRRTPEDPPSVRMNERGQELTLTLLTSPFPPDYAKIAETIAQQWKALGVRVKVEIPETREDFQARLLERRYDVLLFGQSLLDNLDSYPYWHSSGKQRLTGKRDELRLDAYNLSQYASFRADSLLETIRRTADDQRRQEALRELRDVLSQDVPAIILYSPQYTFAHREDILGVELGALSLHSDRFLTLHRWYMQQERVFQDGRSWRSFIPWVFGLLHS